MSAPLTDEQIETFAQRAQEASPWTQEAIDALAAEVRRLRDREKRLASERDEARAEAAARRKHDEQARVLREALRRAVHHLGTTAPVNGEESLAAWDDYHAAKMLAGCTDDAWDDEAAERGMRRIRREALGAEDDGSDR